MSSRSLFSKLTLSVQSLLIFIVVFAAQLGRAVDPGVETFVGVSLSVASPTVPPGGVLQMQIFITEPKPILKGKQGVKSGARAAVALPVASPLGAVRDAALFSPGGDVSGVAVIQPTGTQFFFTSPLQTFGMAIDTPVMTLAYPVRPSAVPGQTVGLNLDAASSLWLDADGTQYPVELKSGTMTVGGTLAVSDVVPGAGVPLPGTVISIKGVGFTPSTEVDFGEAKVPNTTYVSPNLIQVTLKVPMEIRGQRIRVQNKDTNEEVEYFPYQRTTQAAKSTHALIAASYPLFSQTVLTLGYFRPTLRGTIFSGIALQNLNSAVVAATLQLYSKTGVLLSTKRVTLAKNARIARDLVELFPGVTPGDGTRLKVTSATGIQMLGLLGDDASGMVLPVPASATP